MRKNVVVPLTVAIVLTLGIVFNNAFNDSPTSVSEVCNQEGITKTSSGNDLICEKNGSNLMKMKYKIIKVTLVVIIA